MTVSQGLSKEIRYRLVRLKKVICAKFTESDWRELGLLADCTQIIEDDDRLLRSLFFGDNDYETRVISVLEKIAQKNTLLVDEIEAFVSREYPSEYRETFSVDKMICNPSIFSIPKEAPDPKLIALMIPFAAEFEPVSAAIKEAACECGMTCKRAKDIWKNSEIIQDVFSLIYRARIVICDFSSKNPNVFYEAGIAHTLGRKVIPLAQNAQDIPFDLVQHRHLIYFPNEQGVENMKDELAKRIRTLMGS